MTGHAIETKAPPTLADLIALADANDEAGRRLNQQRAIESAQRLTQQAREAAQRAIGIDSVEADIRLGVALDEDAVIARIYYASPDGMDGSFYLRYVPARHLGGGYGYTLDHVVPLHNCGGCNGLVARHVTNEEIRDPLTLGYALRKPVEPVKYDVGHEPHCSLAYNEDEPSEPPTSPPVVPQTPSAAESLHRIAAAVEELVDRWRS